MKQIDQIIIANQDQRKNEEIERMLRESGYTGNIKSTLNAGHALLCLDHLTLRGCLYESKVLVLLNLNTPIVNGLEFLTSLKENKSIRKENIILIVLSDNPEAEINEKARKKGVKEFLPFSFNMEDLFRITESYFKPADKKRTQVKLPASVANYARI